MIYRAYLALTVYFYLNFYLSTLLSIKHIFNFFFFFCLSFSVVIVYLYKYMFEPEYFLFSCQQAKLPL